MATTMSCLVSGQLVAAASPGRQATRINRATVAQQSGRFGALTCVLVPPPRGPPLEYAVEVHPRKSICCRAGAVEHTSRPMSPAAAGSMG